MFTRRRARRRLAPALLLRRRTPTVTSCIVAPGTRVSRSARSLASTYPAQSWRSALVRVARSAGSMRNHFDYLAKELGQAALGPSGITVINDRIHPETQYADLRYEPDPARQAARDRLGLLGRIAGDVCLIEVYSQAPSAEEFRACLAK